MSSYYIDKISEMSARFVSINFDNIDKNKYETFLQRTIDDLDSFSNYIKAINHVKIVATASYSVSSYDKDALEMAHLRTEMADKGRRNAHKVLIGSMQRIERTARNLGMDKFFNTDIEFLNKDFNDIPPSSRDALSNEMAVLFGEVTGNNLYNSLDVAFQQSENGVPKIAKQIENIMNDTAQKYMELLNVDYQR